MDKIQKLMKELESILTEEINCVRDNPIYEPIKSLYPQILVEKTFENLRKEIYRYDVFVKTVKLAQQYKNCHDYVSEHDIVIKLADLLSVADEPVTFDGFDKEELERAKECMLDIKEQLYSLGFNNFIIFENEEIKRGTEEVAEDKRKIDDKTYYEGLFAFSNNASELITLYCKNTSYEKGLNKKRLKLIQEILLKKKCDIPSDFQFFEARIRRRYRSLGVK